MTELDDALRAMLRERAGDVRDLPADFLDLDSLDTLTFPDERVRRLRRSGHSAWLVAAAVACVALVTAAIVAINHSTHKAQPAHPSTTAAPTKVAVSATCATTLPGAWVSAYKSSVLPSGGRTTMPLSVTADGGVLALRDSGPLPGSPRDVVLLRPGTAPKVMYSVPTPDTLSVQAADLSGPYLVVAVAHQQRHPKGTIGNGSTPNIHSLVVIDTRTNTQKVLDGMSDVQSAKGTHQIALSFVLDGSVYWGMKATYASKQGVIYEYTLATGKKRVAYAGPMDYLSASAAGIGATDGNGSSTLYVSAHLPTVVQRALPPNRAWTLVSDGSAYAWAPSGRVVGWWRPGLATPKYFRLSALPDGQAYGTDAVSGKFVALSGDDSLLLDTSTGALAPLTVPGLLDAHTRSFATWLGRGTVFAGFRETGPKGHFISGYWADSPDEVLRVDVRTLPGLHC